MIGAVAWEPERKRRNPMVGMLVRAVIFGLGVEVGREIYQTLKHKAGKGECGCTCHDKEKCAHESPAANKGNGNEKAEQ
jgi:hypothetical protein